MLLGCLLSFASITCLPVHQDADNWCLSLSYVLHSSFIPTPSSHVSKIEMSVNLSNTPSPQGHLIIDFQFQPEIYMDWNGKGDFLSILYLSTMLTLENSQRTKIPISIYPFSYLLIEICIIQVKEQSNTKIKVDTSAWSNG